MDASVPPTREGVQQKWLELIDDAGPGGLRVRSKDFERNVCGLFGVDSRDSTMMILVVSAVNNLPVKGTVTVAQEGKDIELVSKGEVMRMKEFRVYRRPPS